jgi:hypothetical protein
MFKLNKMRWEVHFEQNISMIVCLSRIWYWAQKNIYMCVYCHMSKKSRVGRSALILFLFFTIGKTGNSRSRFLNPIPVFHFRNFGKPSFVLKLFYDELHSFSTFFALNFDKKASGWINKTLLPIKQQKWLSEFCVKIDRVASKN